MSERDRPEILDAHMHAWDTGRFHMAWATGRAGFAERPVSAYRVACAATGIVAAMIVEADVASHERRGEAEDFSARCVRGEAIGAVACLDPRREDFAAGAKALSTLPGIRAVRWIARTAADTADLVTSPRARESLELLGSLGLAFDLNVPPGELARAALLAASVPGTRIVLDHCGNADPAAFGCAQARPPAHDADVWQRGLDALAALPHVACKISGIVSGLAPGTWSAGDLAPVIERCRAAFGPRRILFGSDWPVCTFAGSLVQWLDAARAAMADRPAAERAAFYGGNARHWYALEPSAP